MKKEATSAAKAKTGTTSQKVQFELFAPDAQEVSLAGTLNNWDSSKHPMKKDKKGIWKKALSLKSGQYEYRFLVDGQWENDPACPNLVANDFGSQNNLIIVD